MFMGVVDLDSNSNSNSVCNTEVSESEVFESSVTKDSSCVYKWSARDYFCVIFEAIRCAVGIAVCIYSLVTYLH